MGLLGATYASAYRPTVRDKVAAFLMGNAKADSPWGSFVEGMVGSTGVGPAKRGLFGAPGVLDWTPLGLPFQADEAGRQIAQGHPIQGAANLAMALPIPAAKVAKGLGGAGKRAVQEAGEQAAKKVIAYHGSPHKFDRFSLDSIGTGEGAQAYGHGLYFAENEATAKSYRDALSGPTNYAPKDRSSRAADKVGSLMSDGKSFESAVSESRLDLERQRDDARELLGWYRGPDAGSVRQHLSETEAALAELDRLSPSAFDSRDPGNMYQVQINADPEHFLDWDKPISDQSEHVRRALGWTPEAEAAYYAAQGADTDNLLAALMGDAQYTEKRPPVPNGLPPLSATGADIAKGGSVFDSAADAARSAKLRDAGIPGIKYLDAGSRGTGEGSRNYVVFNDKLIEIMKRYGIALPGAGLAYQAYQDQK